MVKCSFVLSFFLYYYLFSFPLTIQTFGMILFCFIFLSFFPFVTSNFIITLLYFYFIDLTFCIYIFLFLHAALFLDFSFFVCIFIFKDFILSILSHLLLIFYSFIKTLSFLSSFHYFILPFSYRTLSLINLS